VSIEATEVPYGCNTPLIKLVTWLSAEHELRLTWPMGSPERMDRAIRSMGLDAVGEAVVRLSGAVQSVDAGEVLAAMAEEREGSSRQRWRAGDERVSDPDAP